MIEVYAPTGAGIGALSSTKYWVDVYDDDTETYFSAFTFSRSRKAIAAYGVTDSDPVARNKLWVSGSSPELSFLTFGASGETTVRITKLNEAITDIKLRPASKNFEYSVTAGKAYIQMSPNDKVWATINNETSSPLFLFCDNFKPSSEDADLYFGPGIHYLSSLAPTATGGHVERVYATTAVGVSTSLYGVNFSSYEYHGYVEGQPFTIYLDGGSYVIGTFDVRDRHNITFKGPGILSVQHMPKEKLLTLSAHNAVYPGLRDLGAISIFGNAEFDQLVSTYEIGALSYTLPSVDNIPSGINVKDITIIDTPVFNIRGVNNVENVKILSPWSYNTDGIYTVPDPTTKSCYVRDCFLLTADDCIYPFTNDAGSPTFQDLINTVASVTGYEGLYYARTSAGGATTISGCQFYSVNNGPLVVSYHGVYYYNDNVLSDEEHAYPIKIYDCDIGSYSVNRQNVETCIRLCNDLSSVNRDTSAGLYAFSPNLTYTSWGLKNITVSDIRVEDPIDTQLFWIGNIPDPFADNPSDPQLGDRGNEFGFISGVIFKDITVSGSEYNTSAIYNNRIWGRDASSRPVNITLENIKINGTYLTNATKDYFISWASGANSTLTNPDVYDSKILFLFDVPIEDGYVTKQGVKVDYLWDRGQLHPFVATLHYIQEQAKVMQASAYYDDNLSEVAASGWWRNLLHNYANTLTESSGAFPNSFDNYTTYKFGRDFQKLYYDYTHNFNRHKAVPTTIELDGPTIFGHTFGSVLYNSDLSKNSSLTNQYPEYITSSLTNVYEFKAGSVLFSTSGSSSGTYVASSITDCYVEVSELRNSGILSHIEFSHTSGTSVNNSFAVIRLNKADRLGYRYNPLNYENTLIKHKGAPGGFSRVIFDISKYSTDSNLGYDVSTNFLSPEHDFKLNFKTIIANNKGEIFGGSPVGIWIHTKPELGKIWSFTDGGRWVQHSVSSLTKSEVVDHYSHIFELPTEQRDLESSSIRCNRFRLIENKNQENDVIASLSESEFTDIEVNFNTKNYACRGEKIDVPEEYFSNVARQVHRLGQKYVIEVFSLDRDLDKFTLFYDFNLVDSTLNKWSKPFVLGKGSTGLPVGDLYCKEYRVDLTPRHLYNIIKYFNEIAGGATSVGYASRNENQTSGIYESRGGSRINYVENPNWNPNTKSAQGQLINEVTIKN